MTTYLKRPEPVRMNQQEIIDTTANFVKEALQHAEGGHDWWHIQRVWNNAVHIARHEDVDLLTVELAALLHDIADAKFHHGDEHIGPAKATAFLRSMAVEEPVVEHVADIIRNISFKGGNVTRLFHSKELWVVMDADRLDAIGAIGISRAFHYGGFTNRQIYDPAIVPDLHMTKETYKTSTAPTINHFYEKLLLLKDRMNTATGKQMAIERHQFMLQFLEQFYAEWKGEK